MAIKRNQVRIDPDLYRRIVKVVKTDNPLRLSTNHMANVLLQYGLRARSKMGDETTTAKGK